MIRNRKKGLNNTLLKEHKECQLNTGINVINEIELLKIDTEGHEFYVLKGGKKILNKTKIIQIEIMDNKKLFKKKFSQINNFLLKYNFKLLKIKNIWSVSILSNIKAIDALYINKRFLQKNYIKLIIQYVSYY